MNKTIVVDFGNTLIKCEERHFLNRSKEVDEVSVSTENYIKYNSKIYLMELEGEKLPKDYTKVNRDFVTPLLYGICKNLKDENEVTLNILGSLPIDQIQTKNRLIEQLANKSFNIEYCNKDIKINIETVNIIKECVAGFYTIKEKHGQKILIDIGSLTTNIFGARDGKTIIETTVPIGLITYYKMIAEKHISNGLGKITAEEINMMLDNKMFVEECKDIIEESKNDFVNELVNELKDIVPQINRFEIILIGGGSDEFFGIISEKYRDVKLHSNPIFCNVDGLKIIRKLKGL